MMCGKTGILKANGYLSCSQSFPASVRIYDHEPAGVIDTQDSGRNTADLFCWVIAVYALIDFYSLICQKAFGSIDIDE